MNTLTVDGAGAPPEAAHAVDHLKAARRRVVEQYVTDQPLTRAALHLIDCAAEVTVGLSTADPDAARDALGSARAAVIAATWAVSRIRETPHPSNPSSPNPPAPEAISPNPLSSAPTKPTGSGI